MTLGYNQSGQRASTRTSIPAEQQATASQYWAGGVGANSSPPVNYSLDAATTQQVAGTQESEDAGYQPLIDIVETPEAIIILAELPGYTDEDVVLEGINQQIRISAERPEDSADDAQLHVRERPHRLARTVALPAPVDFDDSEASFAHGVCRITLPKVEETVTHQIGID